MNRLVAALFAVGSLCFLVGALPDFARWVGDDADGWVFFAGSIFFTAAACGQWLGARRDPAAIVQLLGTLFFNRSTFQALRHGLSAAEQNHAVWRPDALGSICFLVSSWLAWRAVAGPRGAQSDRRMALVNLAGSVLFGLSAVGAWVVPSTGAVVSQRLVDAGTALGALCFLVGAVLLSRAQPSVQPSTPNVRSTA